MERMNVKEVGAHIILMLLACCWQTRSQPIQQKGSEQSYQMSPMVAVLNPEGSCHCNVAFSDAEQYKPSSPSVIAWAFTAMHVHLS